MGLFWGCRGLRAHLTQLEEAGELRSINAPLDKRLALAEVVRRESSLQNGGKALLFTDVGGRIPIAANLYGSQARMLSILRAYSYQELSERIETLFRALTGGGNKATLVPHLARSTPYRFMGKAPCQQVVMRRPSLDVLPIPTCWPHDGGPFLTLPMVITKHPETGARNVGMYRCQRFSALELGMHWQVHKTGAAHYRAYKAKSERMPVAIALGGDPLLAYCATAPLPEGLDEWLLAGFLRGAGVAQTRALTVPLLVPAEADIVIEGWVDTTAPLRTEGPFGDHTGFYSLEDLYPVLEVTAITHRRDAVLPVTVVGVPPQEDAYIAEATERIFAPLLQASVAQEVEDFHLPFAGVAHNLALVNLREAYPAQGERIAHLFWSFGQLMFTKCVILLDPSIDIRDYPRVAYAVAKSAEGGLRYMISHGVLDVLDHASPKPAEGGKLLIDARGVTLEEMPRDLPFSMEEVDGGLLYRVAGLALCHVSAQANKEAIHNYNGTAPISITVDETAPYRNPYLLLWLTLANVDFGVDATLQPAAEEGHLHLLLDARAKEGRRPWPNALVPDPETVRLVDEMTREPQLAHLPASPYPELNNFQFGKGAVAHFDIPNSPK